MTMTTTTTNKTKDDEAFLSDLFDAIDSDVKITHIEALEAATNFKVVVRTKLSKADDQNWGEIANNWAERFSIQTGSKYSTRTSKSNMTRLVFRKVFQCKHKECKSRLDMRIKKITKDSIKRDKHLRDGLNAEIKVNFNHTHDK